MHTSDMYGTTETACSLDCGKAEANSGASPSVCPIPTFTISVLQDDSPLFTVSSSSGSDNASMIDTIHTTPAISKASIRSTRRRHRLGSRVLHTPPRRHGRLRGNENPARRIMPSSPLASRSSRPENLAFLGDSEALPVRVGVKKRRALGNITNTFDVQEATPPPPPPKFAFNIRDQLAAMNHHVPNTDSLDDQFLIYRSADEFLPCFVSTPLPSAGAEMLPAMSRTSSGLSDGSCPAFSDIFASASSTSSGGAVQSSSPQTPLFNLQDSFKMSGMATSLSRISGGLVGTLAAKYKHQFPEDYDDNGGVVLDEKFEWEEEMRGVEMNCGKGMFAERTIDGCEEV